MSFGLISEHILCNCMQLFQIECILSPFFNCVCIFSLVWLWLTMALTSNTERTIEDKTQKLGVGVCIPIWVWFGTIQILSFGG